MWRIVEGDGLISNLDLSGTETSQWVVTESVPQCCLSFMASTTTPEDWTEMGRKHLHVLSTCIDVAHVELQYAVVAVFFYIVPTVNIE